MANIVSKTVSTIMPTLLDLAVLGVLF